MKREPKQRPAVVVDLSQQTRAVIYGRGVVMIERSGSALILNDLEAARLVAAHHTYQGRAAAVVEPD